MNTTADSTRHLKTIWRGEKQWHWKALYVGHVQPLGHRTFRRGRSFWQFHVTPSASAPSSSTRTDERKPLP